MDQNLINYVKVALNAGNSTDVVRQALLANGWKPQDVEEAISLAQLQTVKPPGAVPVQTPTNLQPIQSPALTNQSLKPKSNPYSIYSVLLGLVLLISLLILANRVISDIHEKFADSLDARLVYDALIVLPFLIAAFVLHYSLDKASKKFKALTFPYFIVSGWLLLRLLFYVSTYILNSNVAYGIYIVLLLIIGVLTGIIFFVQKFLKD